MKRTGLSVVYFIFLAMVVVTAAVVSNTIFLAFADEAEQKTQNKADSVYETFSVREEILNADCATKDRAIFYREAALNGLSNPDFLNCIGAYEPITLWFVWEETGTLILRDYRIEAVKGSPSIVTDTSGSTLDDFLDFFSDAREYPVVIHNNSTGENIQGVIGFTP